MSKYFLTKNSFLCESTGHAVFLDLERGRYVALPPESAAALPSILSGGSDLNVFFSSGADSTNLSEGSELGEMLRAEGLFVNDEAKGKPYEVLKAKILERTVWNEPGPLPNLRWGHIWSFIVAWWTAVVMLRCFSLAKIVTRVRRRKMQQEQAGGDLLLEDMCSLSTIFHIIQPMFFSSDNECLKNSLTLVEFLARYELYPDWVFGVQMQPFAAHCWIQQGSTVLNDSPQHASSFRPLMMV